MTAARAALIAGLVLSYAARAPDVAAAEPAPTDVAPTDVAPADVAPTDVAPTDVAPTDVAPTDVAPAEPSPTPSVTPAPATVPVEVPTRKMRVNVPVDLTVTGAAWALWLTLALTDSAWAVPCRWCDRDSQGRSTLNAFDDSTRNALRWTDVKTANTLSTVFSFGLAPAAGVAIGTVLAGSEHRLAEVPTDLLVVAESAGIALDVNAIVKYSVARERPDVHARTPQERAASRSTSDNVSFFSGHATVAFALAASAGTVASMRHHRLAPVMWVTGMALASTGAYLRIAADRHYASDVLTGAVVGAAVGFSVPYFFHRSKPMEPHFSPFPLPQGAGLMYSGFL